MLSDLFHTPPEIQIYYPAFFYLCEYRAASTNVPERDMRGLCFWCLIIFSNVSVLFISLFSILLKHTVCVQARISHPVNIDFPLQFIPT